MRSALSLIIIDIIVQCGDNRTSMINACPRCNYPLTGLPDEHVCPECGFRYERDSVKIEEQQLGCKIMAITCGLLSAMSFLMWVSSGHMRLTGLVCLPMFIAAILRLRGGKRCVLVSERQLRLIERSGEEAAYSMEDIAHARWPLIDSSVKVDATSGALLTSIDNCYFRSSSRGRKLAEAINEYKERPRDQ